MRIQNKNENIRTKNSGNKVIIDEYRKCSITKGKKKSVQIDIWNCVGRSLKTKCIRCFFLIDLNDLNDLNDSQANTANHFFCLCVFVATSWANRRSFFCCNSIFGSSYLISVGWYINVCVFLPFIPFRLYLYKLRKAICVNQVWGKLKAIQHVDCFCHISVAVDISFCSTISLSKQYTQSWTQNVTKYTEWSWIVPKSLVYRFQTSSRWCFYGWFYGWYRLGAQRLFVRLKIWSLKTREILAQIEVTLFK